MIGEIAIDLIKDLILKIIESKFDDLDYFKKRKVKSRIEGAIADVIEALIPFFTSEGIDDDKQNRLIKACIQDLQQYISKPELLFQSSLNGQRVFEDIYLNKKLPQEVIEDGLNDTYALLFPRIASLVCRIPEVITGWESEAWAENYKRFDILSLELKQVIQSVDQLKNTPIREADNKLSLIRRSLAQKLRLDLDLTGLRADRPITGKFDNFFVHPEINCFNEDKTILANINSPDGSINSFINKENKSIITAPAGAGK